MDAADMAVAMAGVDVAYYLMHSLSSFGLQRSPNATWR